MVTHDESTLGGGFHNEFAVPCSGTVHPLLNDFRFGEATGMRSSANAHLMNTHPDKLNTYS